MGHYIYFPIMIFGTILVWAVLFQILYTRQKEQKYKLMAIFGGIGSFLFGLEFFIFVNAAIYVIILASLAMGIVGTLWPLGFWRMRNDFRTKIGLMKESDRRKEDEKIRKDFREMIRSGKRNKEGK